MPNKLLAWTAHMKYIHGCRRYREKDAIAKALRRLKQKLADILGHMLAFWRQSVCFRAERE